ncbi:MAG TPA: Gfo/Idh/MocA family oxidoreductase, partial [Candidatus Nitrosopolaris sp.]|nr:Gfo/Idh/MocA family oxidoreductase [Candidatus Nitrosopolaris sp.]
MVQTRICIIGCGTIGRELALAINSGKVRGAKLVALFDTIREAAEKLKNLLNNANLVVFSNFSELTAS